MRLPEHTEQKKKEFLEALEECKGIVADACKAIGIGRTTYYDWLKLDPAFKLQIDDMQEVALDYVESKLFERIDGVFQEGPLGIVYKTPPDTTAIIFYLKTKGKKRGYIERTELTGKDGERLFDANALTDEQLAAIVLSNAAAGSGNALTA